MLQEIKFGVLVDMLLFKKFGNSEFFTTQKFLMKLKNKNIDFFQDLFYKTFLVQAPGWQHSFENDLRMVFKKSPKVHS